MGVLTVSTEDYWNFDVFDTYKEYIIFFSQQETNENSLYLNTMTQILSILNKIACYLYSP